MPSATMEKDATCAKCGDPLRFFGRVSPLGSEPGIEFFKCERCNAIAERSFERPRQHQRAAPIRYGLSTA